jgi:hypothetical protein
MTLPTSSFTTAVTKERSLTQALWEPQAVDSSTAGLDDSNPQHKQQFSIGHFFLRNLCMPHFIPQLPQMKYQSKGLV